MGKTPHRELNARKHKKFVGSKREGRGFADVRKKQIVSKYHGVVARERKNLGAWSEKLKKIYAESEHTADEDPLERFATKKKKKNKGVKFSPEKEPCHKEMVTAAAQSGEEVLPESSGAVTSTERPIAMFGNSRRKRRMKKVSTFYREEKEWQRKQEEKQRRQQEIEAKKREKEAALARNKRTRKHRRRLLAKCNYKGQPNLGSRVQLLLEKIVAQSDASQNTVHRQ